MTRAFENAVLVQTACTWEVMSRKVGNVHPHAHFNGTETVHFLLSAAAIAEAFADRPKPSVGSTIRSAVLKTSCLVGQNTNLGIILLLAPLAAVPWPMHLDRGIQSVLKELSVEDARWAFDAIKLARPGGLGEAPEQDVRDEPTVTLLDAMKLAADRDLIARQYANGLADVFGFGVPAFLAGFERFGCVEAAVIDCQLRWLAEYPDSLIARKNGPAVAAEVRKRAAAVMRLGGIATPEGRAAGVALDRDLRSDGNRLNPGTTADLITACLFVVLRENRVQPSAPFRWPVDDWL